MPDAYRNLVQMVETSVERFADKPRFGLKTGGEWRWITFREFGEQVDAFRGGLASLGVGRGDAVAVIASNRVEWAVGAYATYGLGAVYVPMYEKQHIDDWRYIINDCGAKVLLVANDEIAAKTAPLVAEVPSLQAVVNFGGAEPDPRSYAALLAAGRRAPVPAVDPEPHELAGLIYTSGTTGNPKGVRLTHRNFTSNVNAVQERFPMRPGEVSLSFLPWAHSFGQTCELHTLLAFGGASALNTDVTNLLAELGEVRPTVFFSVPRVYNKIYDGLHKKMAESAVKKALFDASLANAAKRRELAAQGKTSSFVEMKHKLFDRIIFTKIRDRLGGRLQYAFSGGAAISPEVATFLDNVGIVVFEGYGLSETSPIATMNYPGGRKIGTVGKAIPEVEILIDPSAAEGAGPGEGEILVRGPNIMQGYHRLDDQTRAVLREDGAFRTGDLGRFDEEGFLVITGRIKEQYKLENGKYVVPVPLEEQLQLSGFISQAFVWGDNKLHNVALIVPDWAALKAAGIEGAPAELCKDDRVKAKIREELDRQQRQVFKGYERVQDFRLVADEFSVDNDMLTPKMSMKRRNIVRAYEGLLGEMYS